MNQKLPFKRSLLLTTLLLFCAGFSTSLFAQSQCTQTVFSTDTTICVGDTITLASTASGPGTPLQTTYATNNNHRGNMFDIVAINAVTIDSFWAHPLANTTIEIYYKVGTHVGSEANAAAWTLVGSAAVISNGSGNATPVPVNVNVSIPAGQTYAFYVTSNNTAVNCGYTDGTSRGSVYASDANIQFLEGSGMDYPFTNSGSIFQPRVWNGTIFYSTAAGSYLWSTGATSSTIVEAPTTTTTYSLTYSQTNPTCSHTDSLTITVAPTPVPNLGPDTYLCPQDSLTLNPGTDPSYLYNWSSGGSNPTETITSGGTISVTVTDPSGTCSGTDDLVVTARTAPTVDLGADTILCNGDTLQLNADGLGQAPGGSFLWNDGDVNQLKDILTGGTYSVVTTDTFGCSGTDDVLVTLSSPVVNLGPDTSFCTGTTVTLDAGSGGISYLWSDGSTTSSITTTTGGTYSVTCVDSFNCNATDDIVLTEESTPTASFVASNTGGSTYSFTNNSTGGGSCTWDFGDGGTSPDANPTHTYSTAGTFAVTLICTNACGSDTVVDSVNVLSGIAEVLVSQHLQLYPNPNTGRFFITYEDAAAQQVEIEIWNGVGKKVQAFSLERVQGRFRKAMDLTSLSSGMYYIRVQADGKMGMRKLILE